MDADPPATPLSDDVISLIFMHLVASAQSPHELGGLCSAAACSTTWQQWAAEQLCTLCAKHFGVTAPKGAGHVLYRHLASAEVSHARPLVAPAPSPAPVLTLPVGMPRRWADTILVWESPRWLPPELRTASKKLETLRCTFDLGDAAYRPGTNRFFELPLDGTHAWLSGRLGLPMRLKDTDPDAYPEAYAAAFPSSPMVCSLVSKLDGKVVAVKRLAGRDALEADARAKLEAEAAAREAAEREAAAHGGGAEDASVEPQPSEPPGKASGAPSSASSMIPASSPLAGYPSIPKMTNLESVYRRDSWTTTAWSESWMFGGDGWAFHARAPKHRRYEFGAALGPAADQGVEDYPQVFASFLLHPKGMNFGIARFVARSDREGYRPMGTLPGSIAEQEEILGSLPWE